MQYENKQLQKKYKNDASFRKKADQLEDRYLQLQARTTKMTKDMLIDENILQMFPVDNTIQLYFWYGFMQPHPGEKTSLLTLNFLKLFRPEPGRKFIFVFFNQHTSSSDAFYQFKSIFILLPLSILEHLHAFVIVKPSFYMKAMNILGSSISNSIDIQSYLCFQNCRQLCEKMGLSSASFATFVPEEISEEFPEQRMQKPLLAVYRQNIRGQTMTMKEQIQKREFQLSVKSFLAKEVYTIESFQEGQIGIPKILEILINYFKNKPQGLKLQGIFRKSVSIDEQNYILEQLGQKNYDYLATVENPYLIACLIKRFFYNLKIPVIPFSHYKKFLADPQLPNIKKVINDLPKKNYLTILFLLDFLIKDVVQKQEYNKMSAYAIAVCFSQSLMRAQEQTEEALLNSKKIATITNMLISHFEDIFDDGEVRKRLEGKHHVKKKEFQKTVQKELSIQIPDKFSAADYSQINQIISYRRTERFDLQLAPINLSGVKLANNFNKKEESLEQKPQQNIKEEEKEQKGEEEAKEESKMVADPQKSANTLDIKQSISYIGQQLKDLQFSFKERMSIKSNSTYKRPVSLQVEMQSSSLSFQEQKQEKDPVQEQVSSPRHSKAFSKKKNTEVEKAEQQTDSKRSETQDGTNKQEKPV